MNELVDTFPKHIVIDIDEFVSSQDDEIKYSVNAKILNADGKIIHDFYQDNLTSHGWAKVFNSCKETMNRVQEWVEEKWNE